MSPDWRDSANCLGTDPEAWFTEGSAPYPHILRDICAESTVLADCRAAILSYEDDLSARSRFGFVAGMTPVERRRAWEEEHPTQGRQLSPCGTWSAYKRHKKAGEPVDDVCREAMRIASQRRRRLAVA